MSEMTVWILMYSEDWAEIESVWSTEPLAKAAHKRLHPRSILDEPRCYEHVIEGQLLDFGITEAVA